MSDLLVGGRLIIVRPTLVRRLGLLEAAIVQQIHYWTDRATKTHDGHAYVYKTYQHWSDEIGVSAKAVRGALDRLRASGVVVAIQNPSDPRDRTLWWRIDQDVLDPPAGHAGPGSSSSAPAGSSSPAPTGTSNAGASRSGTEMTTEKTSRERASAKAQKLPDDFPEELKPHARRVFAILRDIAEQHNAKEVTPRGVGLAIQGNPSRQFVAVAYELASWAQSGRDIKDAVGTYRTFLKRADRHAGIERFGDVVVAGGENVHPIRGGKAERVDWGQVARDLEAKGL